MGLRKTRRLMTSTSASMILMTLRGSSIRSRLIPTRRPLSACCWYFPDKQLVRPQGVVKRRQHQRMVRASAVTRMVRAILRGRSSTLVVGGGVERSGVELEFVLTKDVGTEVGNCSFLH